MELAENDPPCDRLPPAFPSFLHFAIIDYATPLNGGRHIEISLWHLRRKYAILKNSETRESGKARNWPF
jgi:hypothetical protein